MYSKKDLFAHKSKTWDTESGSAKTAKSIAELIVKNIKLDSTMEVMDFGAGTGLLGYFIAPYVGRMVAVDNSPAMLLELKNKDFPCKLEVLEKDLSVENIEKTFDGIISSMTIHHLEDIEALFTKFYAMLKPDGFMAVADLDIEDGSFHSDNTGVFHYGFDRHVLAGHARNAGFKDVTFSLASTISKPQAEFTVFLMTAVK